MTKQDNRDQTTRKDSSREQYLDIVRRELDQFEQRELALQSSERRERLARLLGETDQDPRES